MIDVPRAVRQTIAARAVDAFEEFTAAVDARDEDGARRALDELREAFMDDEASLQEFLTVSAAVLFDAEDPA